MGLKQIYLKIKFDVQRFKRLLLVYCMLYVVCICVHKILTPIWEFFTSCISPLNRLFFVLHKHNNNNLYRRKYFQFTLFSFYFHFAKFPNFHIVIVMIAFVCPAAACHHIHQIADVTDSNHATMFPSSFAHWHCHHHIITMPPTTSRWSRPQQCIVLILVLTAAACGLYQSRFQADGSIALYALAVTSVNVILIMLATAVIGLYAALKLSRFVIACVSGAFIGCCHLRFYFLWV